jgi:hypothetical protein
MSSNGRKAKGIMNEAIDSAVMEVLQSSGVKDNPVIEPKGSGEEEKMKSAPMVDTTLLDGGPPAKVSVTGTTSGGSSVSSSNCLLLDPLTRQSSAETLSGVSPLSLPRNGDSLRDESTDSQQLKKAPTTMMKSSMNKEERVRKLSITESESSAGAASPLKKQRLFEPSGTQQSDPPKFCLLAQATDPSVLSPVHVWVRQQIEVFTATEEDMAQPAPGRKNRIQLHQVGLRCIHCARLPPKDRVKRAICYPSSVGRVYHSVSDMKFDHFGACKGLPPQERAMFQELKEENKLKRYKKKVTAGPSCSSSTAQYYHDTARQMGMVDYAGFLFMAKDLLPGQQQKLQQEVRHESVVTLQSSVTMPVPILPKTFPGPLSTIVPPPSPTALSNGFASNAALALAPEALPSHLMPLLLSMANNIASSTTPTCPLSSSAPVASTCRLLTTPEDVEYLNPLHCFVRRHIEVFVAEADDISAPSPGRKTRVVLGQVGIRCIHCARLPPKDRVKRSVCYPANVSGIYHSVSNMKFDHFAKCRGLPEPERVEFARLRESCGRHGPRSTGDSGKGNSTSQFYHDSAVRMGLVDSDTGIRFRHMVDDNNNNRAKVASVPDGISALMIAASVRAASGKKESVLHYV